MNRLSVDPDLSKTLCEQLPTELFRLQAGIDIVIIQYKGGGPEAGVAGAEANNWWGIVAPAGALRLPPAEFTRLMAVETAKWTRVVRDAGIKAE